MAMATSYSSMAYPPITSKTPFPNKQVHSPKQSILLFFDSSLFLAFLIIFVCFSKVSNWIPTTISNGNGTGGMFSVARRNSRIGVQVHAVTGDQGSRNVSDVKFPSDYPELLMQVIGGRTQFLKVASFMGCE
jgi:hypothetical protein